MAGIYTPQRKVLRWVFLNISLCEIATSFSILSLLYGYTHTSEPIVLITYLAAMYNVLFMIMMSWMSSLCRCVLFLPGLWPTNAGYCFVSERRWHKWISVCVSFIKAVIVVIMYAFYFKFLIYFRSNVNPCVLAGWENTTTVVGWAPLVTINCRLKLCCTVQCNFAIASGSGWKRLIWKKHSDRGAGLCEAGWPLFLLSWPAALGAALGTKSRMGQDGGRHKDKPREEQWPRLCNLQQHLLYHTQH